MKEGSSEQFVAPVLNSDVHYNLIDEKQIVYLRNGDVQDLSSNNNGVFVQNALGNSLCQLGNGTFINSIKLDKSNHAVFYVDENTGLSSICYFDSDACTMETVVSSECLGFSVDFPIRGVWKYIGNHVRIYWVDELNPNRYLDLDKINGVWQYPKIIQSGSTCDCNVVYSNELDCDRIRINKCLTVPCLTVTANMFGFLPKGVYQIGYAFGEDDLVLTDFYWSEVVDLNNKTNSIELNIECVESDFSHYTIYLVSHTSNGTVVYNLGSRPVSTKTYHIDSLNYPITTLQEALEKRTNYDYSKHIAVNDKRLVLGGHKMKSVLSYQKQALSIEAEWVEYKVAKKDAHKYRSLPRDEVVAISIEWFDKKGKSKHISHIPGKPNPDYFITYNGDTYFEQDDVPAGIGWEENPDCTPEVLKVWQYENTATGVGASSNPGCETCGQESISAWGNFGYYETEDELYPNTDDFFGNHIDLRCLPIRHHRVPSSDITHIHGTGSCENVETQGITGYNGDGSPIYGTITKVEFVSDACISLLGLRLKNIEHPKLSDGSYDMDISGYRVLYGDRKNWKSVLHKGLIFNTWNEKFLNGENSIYPNYPYNDLGIDSYLSTSATTNQPATSYNKRKFTYHSPEIHYEENNQFGDRFTLYTEEIGHLTWQFNDVYGHPLVQPPTFTAGTNAATQFDSTALYDGVTSVIAPFEKTKRIINSQYLLPIKQYLSDKQKFNNLYREESFYFESASVVENPLNIDTSRFILDEVLFIQKDDTCQTLLNGVRAGNPIQAVSYYVGIKRRLRNQYGELSGIKYLPFDNCITRVTFSVTPYESPLIRGGDTRISLHNVKRKMLLFTSFLQDVPFDTEYAYRQHRNVWWPIYHYDTLAATDVFSLDSSKFYVSVNGNLNFWCESEFVGDYRDSDSRPNSQYLPNISISDLFRADSIKLSEVFLYNQFFKKQTIESKYQDLTPSDIDNSFIVTYSQRSDIESGNDKWLDFQELNYLVLPKDYGEFTGIHTIYNDSIFFVFENEILMSRVDYQLQTTSGQNVFLQTGDIFSQRLQRLGNDVTGYVGSVDPFSFINTRFGTFWLDRLRKRFFRYTNDVDDVTSNMSAWFQKYLIDTTMTYENSAITVFDNFTENIYITDKANRQHRWTLSFKPRANGFISWHDFHPDFYLIDRNTFLSANVLGIWKHNQKPYQTYYGVVYPFELGFVINNKFQKHVFQSLQVWAEYFIPEYWNNQYSYNKFFNKILMFNNFGSSGVKDLLLKNKHDETYLGQNINDYVEVTQVEDSEFRLNKMNNFQLGQPNIQLDENGYTYTIPSTVVSDSQSQIRGKWLQVHLIDELNPEYKKLIQINVTEKDKISQ